MRIKEIKLGLLHVPMKKPFRTALRTVERAEDLIVQCVLDSGVVGFGSAASTERITGENHASMIRVFQDSLIPLVEGLDLSLLADIQQMVDQAGDGHRSAKSALHCALLDAYCKAKRLNLSDYWGAEVRAITTDVTISMDEPNVMAQDAKLAVSEGFRELKIKIGSDSSEDLERVKCIAHAVGNSIELRLDANQGWNPEEAVRNIRELESLGLNIAFIEQPVQAQDLDGFKFVTDHVRMLTVADESLFSLADAEDIVSRGVADVLNIKLLKAGGLQEARKIADYAANHGVPCLMSCMLETIVGITAGAWLASVHPNIRYVDLDADHLQNCSSVVGGIQMKENRIHLPRGFGIGIERIDGLISL